MRPRLPAALLTITLATSASGQAPVIDGENLKERAQDDAQSGQTQRSADDSKKQTERTACNIMNKDFSRRLGMNIKDVVKEEPENVALIRSYAKVYGVSDRLALSVSYAESRLSSCAGSPTGVKGVMQLTKRTGQSLGGYDREVNEQNIEGGVKLLARASAQCGETDFTCLASIYNGSTTAEQSGWARTAQRGYDQLAGATESDSPQPGSTYASVDTGDMPASSPAKTALDRSSTATKNTADRLAASANTIRSNASTLKSIGDGTGEQERFQSGWDENTQARGQVGQLWNQAIDTQTMANMLLVARIVDEVTRLSQIASLFAFDQRTAKPFTGDCGLLALQGQATAGCRAPGLGRTFGLGVQTADGGFVRLSPASDAASVRHRLQQLQDIANAGDAAAPATQPPGSPPREPDPINAALAALATAAGGH